MLSILDRYFLRELAQTVAATVVVLMVIVAGTAFATVLQQVAKGSFPASVMFQVLGLRTLEQLTNMLPLASMIGVLMALGRMYRESEMHVLMSSGMGPNGLLRPTSILAVALVLLTALVALWLGPWASATSDTLVAAANRSVIAAGLDAGRFTELPGKGGIIFTDTLSQDGTRLGRSFVSTQRTGRDGQQHVKVVTAGSGQLYQESNGSNRFISFHDGWQYDIPLGGDNWRRMQYQRNDSSLSSVTSDDEEDPAESMTTLQLLRTETPDARSELAWRANAPALTLVMLMLALWVRKVRGAILISIVVMTLVAVVVEAIGDLGTASEKAGGWALTVPAWTGDFHAPDFGTVGEFNLLGSWESAGIVVSALLVFTLMLVDFFDTLGTMTAVGAEAGLLDEEGNPPNIRRILVVDSIAAAARTLLATANSSCASRLISPAE